ncbi:hypothetical protein GQ44DRAFT_730421 [Phaeosphaeriaceae sp. PMI808]|nr:hypothetical protein GQ44DRAFT_730421 [Phaeosphaeriaceae sp. PMI808]
MALASYLEVELSPLPLNFRSTSPYVRGYPVTSVPSFLETCVKDAFDIESKQDSDRPSWSMAYGIRVLFDTFPAVVPNPIGHLCNIFRPFSPFTFGSACSVGLPMPSRFYLFIMESSFLVPRRSRKRSSFCRKRLRFPPPVAAFSGGRVWKMPTDIENLPTPLGVRYRALIGCKALGNAASKHPPATIRPSCRFSGAPDPLCAPPSF